MGNTIDAKLRIITDAAQAIAQLQQLRAAALQTKAALAAPAPGSPAGAPAAQTPAQITQQAAAQQTAAQAAAQQAAKQAAQQTAQQAAAQRLAAKQAAQQAAQQAAAQQAAARKAAADALSAQQEAQRQARAANNLQLNAMRQLPAQVTDIVTSLQGGQRPLTVLIQQGGQLNDAFGSPIKVLKAFASLLTPTRVLVGGLAVGIGVLAGLAHSGYAEQDKLNKALLVTGDAANASLGQIDSAARRVATSSKSSIGDVRETLQALVEAGAASAGALDQTTRAATAYRKITGASASEAAALFGGQRDAVLDWATKANKAYNFLTAAQLDHIRVLQSQGRQDQAVRFANDELAKSLEQRVGPAIGALERGWNAVASALSSVLDKLKAIGRDDTPEERLAKLQQRLRELQDRKAGAEQPKTLDPTKSIVGQMLSRDKKTQDSLAQPAVKNDDIAAAEAAVEAQQRVMNMDAKRRAELAIDQANEREKALRASKAYTDAEASVTLAGLQRAAAVRSAALDKEQSDLEKNRAGQLIGEQEFNLSMNDLDRRRLQSQRALLQEQLKVEQGRKSETPLLDALAKAASIKQLGAQLVAVESQIAQAGSKTQELLATDATAQAAKWEAAWEDAAQRIRQYASQNALADVGRTEDPAGRARAAAAAAIEELQREFTKQKNLLQYQVDITLNPVKARQLQQELDKFVAEGSKSIGEVGRKAQLDDLFQQSAERFAAMTTLEQDYDRQVTLGALTTEEAEDKKNEARRAALPLLRQILQLQSQLVTNPGEKNQRDATTQSVLDLDAATKQLQSSFIRTGQSGFTDFLNNISLGAKSGKDALLDMVAGFGKALLNLINQRLAEKLFKSLDSAGGSGGWTGWLAGLFSGASGSTTASVKHSGGLISSGLGGAARAISMAAFAGAQVLHSGGMVGLASNEVPVIAEVGEEMLTADDPRHRDNFKGGGFNQTNHYSFDGSGMSEAEQRAFVEGLDIRIRTLTQSYVTEQRRQGGIFSGLGRG